MMAHTASSSSNSEERVQQLMQLQLAQRQEVATVSSALQAANIRVQTLETQLRTAQVPARRPVASLTICLIMLYFLCIERVVLVALVGCQRAGPAAIAR